MKRTLQKALTMLLTAAMILNMGLTPVLGETTTNGASGLTDCHIEHDSDCGFTEGTAEQPCTFIPEEDGVASPADATGHSHDEDCGYVQAIKGTPCTHTCQVCEGLDSSKPPEKECTCQPLDREDFPQGEFVHGKDCPLYTATELSESVMALIVMVDELPNATDITEENKEAAMFAFEAAAMAYGELTAEDRMVFEQTSQYEKLMALGDVLSDMAIGAIKESGLTVSDNSSHTAVSMEDSMAGVYTVIGDATISGASAVDRILVTADATITLNEVDIELYELNNSAMEIAPGTTVILKLQGKNTLSSYANGPGILVNEGAELIIEDDNEDSGIGTLHVKGAQRGKLTAGSGGGIVGAQMIGFAGIGSKNYNSSTTYDGTITIRSGSVNATGYDAGAGIGGGDYASGGNINIEGGTVEATAKGDRAAGWAGEGNASGIGGSYGSDSGTIRITGGTITAVGSNTCPGIGGQSAEVTIEAGIVHATGGNQAAGIGGRQNPGNINITIGSDADVTAIAGSGASAIGEGTATAANLTLAISEGASVKGFSDGKKPAIKNGENAAVTDAALLIATGKPADMGGVSFTVDKTIAGTSTFEVPKGVGSFACTVPDVSAYTFTFPDRDYILAPSVDVPALLSAVSFVNIPVKKCNTTLAATIYLDGTVDKSGDGKTAETAVKTYAEAVGLIQEGGRIHVTGTVTISDEQDWSGEEFPIRIVRDKDFRDTMFVLNTGADLYLVDDITIDGGGFPSNGPIFQINAGTLELESDDAGSNPILQNNYNRGNGGGVYVNGGTLIIKDSVITKNAAAAGSGVYVKSGTMKMFWKSIISQNTGSADLYLSNGCNIGIAHLSKITTPTVVAMESKTGAFAIGTRPWGISDYVIKESDKAYFSGGDGFLVALEDGRLTLQKAPATVTSVEVTPSTASVETGRTQSFTAEVIGTNDPSQNVTWDVAGGQAGTTIVDGLLTVAQDETATALTVTATSTEDKSKSGTADVTVTTTYAITASAGAGGTISPSGSVPVAKGENQSFTISANSNYSISSVTVDDVNLGVISTYTFSDVTDDHSISATFLYNGGGGGSTGGDDENNNDNSTVKDPTLPTTGEIKAPVTVDKGGNAHTEIPDSDITDVIKEAQDRAKKDGTTANGIAVAVHIDTEMDTNSLTVTLLRTTLDRLISAGTTNFTLKSSLVTLSFDLEALKQLQSQSSGDITFTAAKRDVKEFSKEAQEMIGSRPVFRINVSCQKDGESVNVTEYGNGSILVGIPYDMDRDEVSGNLCGVYVNGDGKAAYLTRSSYHDASKTMLISTNHLSAYGVAYKRNAPIFTDTADHWAKDDIQFVAVRGLLTGAAADAFSPDSAMTRGMFVTALGRLADADVSSYKTSSFTDVAADSEYLPYVEWAVKNNIITGTSAATFAPDQAITRQEMAVMTANYAKAIGRKLPSVHKEIVFTDSRSIAAWAKSAVQEMQMAGVIMGKNSGKFDPTGTATRAQGAAMLRRFAELSANSETAQGWANNDSGNWMYFEDGKVVTGKRTIGGTTYEFDQYGVTQ